IEGKVEGKIQSKGKVSFGSGAQITAEVSVGEAKIEGTFKGNLTATQRIELASTAHVMGDVRSTKLVIAEGATFVGNCHVSPDSLKGAEKRGFVTPVAATPMKKLRRGAMSKDSARRLIFCPRCDARQEVSRVTKSTSCPSCHRNIMTTDVDINEYCAKIEMWTAGTVTVGKKGTLIAEVRAE